VDTFIIILHYCPISPCFQHIAPYALHAAFPVALTLPEALSLPVALMFSQGADVLQHVFFSMYEFMLMLPSF
jgi:hypothetical protein